MSAPASAEVLSLARWQEAWRRLGAADPADPAGLDRVHTELLGAYAEPHRHYHTARHLAECFGQLAAISAQASRSAEIEIALWFHDAIYDTRRSDNELRSARWASRCALEAGIAADCAGRIHKLVMATRHAAQPTDADARVLVDVDLAILGAGPERFEEYERQIRQEYRWVPGFLYRRKRRRLLREFLARPAIFSTAMFRQKYETTARSNLERSLEALGG